MEDFFKELFSTYRERMKSAFFSSFVISWLAWNWKFIYVTLFVSEDAIGDCLNKYEYITSLGTDYLLIYDVNYNYILVLPLLTALGYIVISAPLNLGVTAFIEWFKRMQKNIITNIWKKEIIRKEEHEDIVKKFQKEIAINRAVIEKNDNQLIRKNNEIENLNKEFSSLETINNKTKNSIVNFNIIETIIENSKLIDRIKAELIDNSQFKIKNEDEIDIIKELELYAGQTKNVDNVEFVLINLEKLEKYIQIINAFGKEKEIKYVELDDEKILKDLKTSHTEVGVLKAQIQLLEEKLNENNIDISDLSSNLDEKFDTLDSLQHNKIKPLIKDDLKYFGGGKAIPIEESKEGNEGKGNNNPTNEIDIDVAKLSNIEKNTILQFDNGLTVRNKDSKIEGLGGMELGILKKVKILKYENSKLVLSKKLLKLYVQVIKGVSASQMKYENVLPSANNKYNKENFEHFESSTSFDTIEDLDRFIESNNPIEYKHILNRDSVTMKYLLSTNLIEDVDDNTFNVNDTFIIFIVEYLIFKKSIVLSNIDDSSFGLMENMLNLFVNKKVTDKTISNLMSKKYFNFSTHFKNDLTTKKIFNKNQWIKKKGENTYLFTNQFKAFYKLFSHWLQYQDLDELIIEEKKPYSTDL